MRIKYPILLFICSICLVARGFGSDPASDTVMVKFGNTSKVLLLVEDQKDLEELGKYDINSMLKDLSQKIQEQNDSTGEIIIEDPSGERYRIEETKELVRPSEKERDRDRSWRKRRYGTRYRFGADIGFNNYLENGNFPDEEGALYTVRPLSFNIAINSFWRTHLGGRFFMDWGPNIMWYNYYFQNKNTRIISTDDGVEFVENDPPVDARYSKFGITYVNFAVVPIVHFGRSKGRGHGYRYHDWGRHSRFRGPRIGIGGYSGYRIDSWSKFAFRDESGKKKREKVKDNYFLSNWRYGVRFIFGFRGFTMYTNYDLNTLFSEDRGPELNALSFGISF